MIKELKVGSTEVLLFPMEKLYITQGENGNLSHQLTNAIDVVGDPNISTDVCYAPCTMVCKAKDGYSLGNACFFESVNPVLFADGTTNYATMDRIQ